MQETKYIDEDGNEKRMIEFFSQQKDEPVNKFHARMNNRLFQLEMQGHSLVKQKEISLQKKSLERDIRSILAKS